jgi:hypothetical protein
MPAANAPHPAPLTVLVDDVRGFRDERPALVARSSQEAQTLLEELGDARIDDLWLDHDLVGDDTIRPVVDWMVKRAKAGSPLHVGQIHIHSSNVAAGHWMRLELEAADYRVTRNFSLSMWIRAC